VLQIDAPDLALERHTLFQDKPLAEFLAFVQVVVAAINRALDGIPRDRVRLHVCWGNYEGPHDHDVPLEDIWPAVSQVNAGAIMLSMANPRHAHEYRLFEDPALLGDRLLIPGVIDTTTNYVEHPRTVADRIERVARAVGDPTRIVAGTDCGFETAAGSKMVVEEVVWAKLRALSAGAKLASERLFG
jgi:5-methyltetrahydropteroyltriglutamate--homocysteine methyltransferase